jgi:hypothetical protein
VNLFPDFEQRKMLAFRFNNVNVVLAGIQRKVHLVCNHRADDLLHSVCIDVHDRAYKTSCFLKKSIHVPPTTVDTDRPIYVHALKCATDSFNSFKALNKQIRNGTASQVAISDAEHDHI